MRFRKEFEMPMNKSSTVIATIEIMESNCLEQIIVHTIPGFSANDYATISITHGSQELYRGELVSDGMVIDLEQCLLGGSDTPEITVSVECSSLWAALTGDSSDIDQETYWCKMSMVFLDNHVNYEEIEEFDSGFQSQWA
jgi:hypothetical protein